MILTFPDEEIVITSMNQLGNEYNLKNGLGYSSFGLLEKGPFLVVNERKYNVFKPTDIRTDDYIEMTIRTRKKINGEFLEIPISTPATVGGIRGEDADSIAEDGTVSLYYGVDQRYGNLRINSPIRKFNSLTTDLYTRLARTDYAEGPDFINYIKAWPNQESNFETDDFPLFLITTLGYYDSERPVWNCKIFTSTGRIFTCTIKPSQGIVENMTETSRYIGSDAVASIIQTVVDNEVPDIIDDVLVSGSHALYLFSSTPGSDKVFEITVDDSGALSAIGITETI